MSEVIFGPTLDPRAQPQGPLGVTQGGQNEKIRKYRVVRYRFSEIKGQKLNENVQNNF